MGFGLFVPREHRLGNLGWFPRCERLTPLYAKVAPDVDTLPAAVRGELLKDFDARAEEWAIRGGADPRPWLEATTDKLRRHRLATAFDAGETHARAERLADLSVKLVDFHAIRNLATQLSLDLPAGNAQSTEASIAARCREPKTWRRIIDKTHTREAETELRRIGMIEKGGMLYCSDYAVRWYRSKMAAQEVWLRSQVVCDNQGTQLDLWDVQQKSLSNKSNRRTELMTRMRGFEDYAKENDHVATFFTLTTPSAFHARSTNGADRRRSGPNQSFEGHSVRDGQGWLTKMWARARARLAKLGIVVYGFRIAEPHHDGTPHWHLVLFCEAHYRGLLWAVLRSRWLSEYADEPGAYAHRAEAKLVETAKGSATGYIAKYIAKNIDGFETGELTSDEDSKTPLDKAALRVTAWASLHGIRQFQQIGGPTITVYRELRRQRTPIDLATIEPARRACDAHEFGKFIQLNGGIKAGRSGYLRPWKEQPMSPVREEVDKTTGEVSLVRASEPAQNAYGEVRAPQVIGVMSVSEALETRTKQWRIIRKCGTSLSSWPDSSPGSFSGAGSGSAPDSALGPVSITVPGAPALSDPHGWTNPNETSTYGPN